jgi:hypothetical protein
VRSAAATGRVKSAGAAINAVTMRAVFMACLAVE